jgi:diacylglycerol O-acyltransferase
MILTILDKLLKRFSRFRSVIKGDDFVEGPVDLSKHLLYFQLPKSNDEEEELRKIISEHMNKPLDPTIPLWQIVIIENYSKGIILNWRIHHAVGDGAALFWMFSQLCDDPPLQPNFPTFSLFATIYFYFWLTLGSVYVALKWTWIWIVGAPKTCFKDLTLGTKKNVAWNAVIPLEEARELSHKMKGKINDLMLTVYLGAMDRFRLRHGGKGNRLDINIGVPISLRSSKLTEIDNYFGFCVASMPMGIKDPVLRLKEIKKRMDWNKSLPEQYFAYGFSWICQHLFPTWIVRTMGTVTSNRTITAVMTNVAGNDQPIHFDHLEVLRLPIVRIASRLILVCTTTTWGCSWTCGFLLQQDHPYWNFSRQQLDGGCERISQGFHG